VGDHRWGAPRATIIAAGESTGIAYRYCLDDNCSSMQEVQVKMNIHILGVRRQADQLAPPKQVPCRHPRDFGGNEHEYDLDRNPDWYAV